MTPSFNLEEAQDTQSRQLYCMYLDIKDLRATVQQYIDVGMAIINDVF